MCISKTEQCFCFYFFFFFFKDLAPPSNLQWCDIPAVVLSSVCRVIRTNSLVSYSWGTTGFETASFEIGTQLNQFI